MKVAEYVVPHKFYLYYGSLDNSYTGFKSNYIWKAVFNFHFKFYMHSPCLWSMIKLPQAWDVAVKMKS